LLTTPQEATVGEDLLALAIAGLATIGTMVAVVVAGLRVPPVE
jgi:hypothetical protein